MRVEIEDHTYFVLFRVTEHNPPLEIPARYHFSHGKRKGQEKYLEVSYTTKCAIKGAPTASNPNSLSADYIVYDIESHCSRWDPFDLHKGRRNALKKALIALEEFNSREFKDALASGSPKPTKVDPKPFWDAFVKTLPKPTPTVKQLKHELFQLKTRINEINNMTSLSKLVSIDIESTL